MLILPHQNEPFISRLDVMNMLQKSLAALFALSLAFTACKKKEEAQPQTQSTTVAVADENGMIEKFSFDGNLKATRRDVSFSVTGTTAPSATATDILYSCV